MKHLITTAFVAFTLASPGYAQTSSSGTIAVEHAWARATPQGARTAAAYMTLINQGAVDDRLLGASTPAAANVQFHSETNDNGVIRMRRLPTVDVAPGRTVTFKPGAIHVMMIGLKRQLKEGQTFLLTLDFEKTGKVEVTIPIERADAKADHGMSVQ